MTASTLGDDGDGDPDPLPGDAGKVGQAPKQGSPVVPGEVLVQLGDDA